LNNPRRIAAASASVARHPKFSIENVAIKSLLRASGRNYSSEAAHQTSRKVDRLDEEETMQ
jgi:hypothetical protein